MGAPTTLVPPQEAPSSAPTQKTADAADVMANAMVTATNESAEQQQQQQQAMGGVVSGTVVQQPQQPQAQQRPNGSAAASVDMANWHAQWQAQAATAAALQAALYKTPHANANAFIPPALNPAAFAWVNNMRGRRRKESGDEQGRRRSPMSSPRPVSVSFGLYTINIEGLIV